MFLKQGELNYCDLRNFPAGPVVRTQRFHCCGPGFNPRQGTKIRKPRDAAKK